MNSETMQRQFLPPLAELLDRMTVTQIKLAKISHGAEDFELELKKLQNDIDIIIKDKKIVLKSKDIRNIVALSQLNLHIWHNKDEMQKNLDNDSEYLRLLKLAHQLNGYRNIIKNKFLELEGVLDNSQKRSNFEVDGLDWKL